MMTNCAGMWLGLVAWTWDFEKAGLEHHPSSTAGPSGLGTLGQEALATQRTTRTSCVLDIDAAGEPSSLRLLMSLNIDLHCRLP